MKKGQKTKKKKSTLKCMEKVMSYLAQTKDVLMRTVKDEVGKAG